MTLLEGITWFFFVLYAIGISVQVIAIVVLSVAKASGFDKPIPVGTILWGLLTSLMGVYMTLSWLGVI